MFDVTKTRIRHTRDTIGLLRLLLVIALIGPATVLVFVTLQSRALLLDTAANRANRMAELLAQHATATFDSYNVAFGRIEEHLLHAEGFLQEQPLHEYLAELDRNVKSIDSLVLIDGNGVAVAHSRYFPVPKTYVGDRDYIRDLEDPPEGNRLALVQGRDGLTIGAPILSRYSGKVVLPIARARRDLTGRVAGVIAASMAQDYFEGFYRTLALTGSDRVALVRADSRVLAQIPAAPGRSTIDPDSAAGLDVAALASADAGLAQGRSENASKNVSEGMIDYVSPADDVRRISGLRKLDGYPVYVEVGFNLDAVLEPWRRQALINLAVAALATLVLFAVTRLALTNTRAEAAMQARVLAEAHRRADAEAALRQAQKMEALGQLTGGIAHDFNNLLNIVMVNLELAGKRLADRTLREPVPDLDRIDSHVRGALQGAERGVALTRRLLAFAHRQDAQPSPVQVADLVFGLAELLKQAVGARARIILDCPTGLVPARADPNELETALLNLVVNARDATPESGGRIHIGVREAVREIQGVGIAPATPARFVVLSVQDDGCGMDAAVLTRVTEPFFTTKEGGKGSGLGLAMVDRLALESGGRLVLESRVGAGTTVEIWLPAA